MSELLSTNTQIALMQASQADLSQRASGASANKKAGAEIKNLEEIEAAAKDFEAMFISEMLKPMFEGVMKPDPMFGGGKGEEVFKGMMVQEYGKSIAEAGGIGLARHVKAEMIRIQEEVNK